MILHLFFLKEIQELKSAFRKGYSKKLQSSVRSMGTSKNGPVIDLLSMAPDVSWVRRGLVSAISGFLPPDAQVGA